MITDVEANDNQMIEKKANQQPQKAKIRFHLKKLNTKFERREQNKDSSESKPFQCPKKLFRCGNDGCDKVYKQRSKLTAHLRLHIGFKPFVCQICNKAFNYKWNMKSHQLLHDTETPYKCYVHSCIAAFKNSGDLKMHMKTHSNSRSSFFCPYCNKNFSRYKTVVSHINSLHPLSLKTAKRIFNIEKHNERSLPSNDELYKSTNELADSDKANESLNFYNLEPNCEILINQLLQDDAIQNLFNFNFNQGELNEAFDPLKELLKTLWPMIDSTQLSVSQI
jgi:hypothetical protein